MIRLRLRGPYAPPAFTAACLLLAAFTLSPALAGERDLATAAPADVGMDPAGVLRRKLPSVVNGRELERRGEFLRQVSAVTGSGWGWLVSSGDGCKLLSQP